MLAGAREALAIARGEGEPAAVHQPVDVKALRARLGLTQEEFADRYGVPLGSLRDWEQGRGRGGAAAVLLEVIEQAPKVVEKAVISMRQRSGSEINVRMSSGARRSPVKAAG
jgi:putative transcriptional regulator